MTDLLLLLLFISLGLLLIGLIKPGISLFWSNQSRTRKKSLLTYSILSVAFFLCFGISTDAEKSKTALGKNKELEKNVPPLPDINDSTVAAQLLKYPDLLVQELSKNGIGELKHWNKTLDSAWGSLTDYYNFGTMGKLGLQNNLAYNLYGSASTVKKLNITLNLNNSREKKMALSKMAGLSEQTFKTLRSKAPYKLIQAIQKGKAYKQQFASYKLFFRLNKSNIETWTLDIELK